MTKAGHKVYIERNAGADAGFFDEHYERGGARIVYTAEEAWGRADVVLKVTRPVETEHRLFGNGQTLMSFLHLTVASPDLHARWPSTRSPRSPTRSCKTRTVRCPC